MLGSNRASPGDDSGYFREYQALLEAQHEHLNDGVCVRKALLMDLYMIGRTEDQARPTIIFSCENKLQRQRALKIVRDSSILKSHPGVRLGESSRPPKLSQMPPQLYEPTLNKDVEMLDAWATDSIPSQVVYYSPPLTHAYGIPVMAKVGEDSKSYFRKATIGGCICVGMEYFVLTVGHVFDINCPSDKSQSEDEFEYFLEDDPGDEDGGEYDSCWQVDVTGRGSVSPTESTQSDSISMPTDSSDGSSYPNGLQSPSIPQLGDKPSTTSDDEVECSWKLLGHVASMSQPSCTANLDWALIRIDCPDFIASISEFSKSPKINRIAESPSKRPTVQAFMSSSRVISGRITGSSSYLQLSSAVAFQEVWTVHLDGSLQRGDCGAWVIGLDDNTFYGYIVAGDPETSIAYIIPAHHAILDIERVSAGSITFTPLEYDSGASDDGYPARSESIYTAWDSAIFSPEGSKANVLSSLGTSPPESPSLRSISPRANEHTDIDNLELLIEMLPSKPLSYGLGFVQATPDQPPSQLTRPSFPATTETYPCKDMVTEPGHSSKPRDPTGWAPIFHEDTHDLLSASLHQTALNPIKGCRQGALSSEAAKEAHVVRKAGACWACHLSRTKCSPKAPGSCVQCDSRFAKGRVCWVPCFSDPLESMGLLLVPDILFAELSKSSINRYISRRVKSWGSDIIPIKMSWGWESLPENSQLSPPLGIPMSLLTDAPYKRYIRGIANNNLHSYSSVAYDQSSDTLQQKLLASICTWHSLSREQGKLHLLVRKAIETHIMCTILGRALFIESSSLELIEQKLQIRFPPRTSAIILQLQMKGVIFSIQRARIMEVLEEWGKVMWTPNRRDSLTTCWATTFSVLSLLILVMDKTINTSIMLTNRNSKYQLGENIADESAEGENAKGLPRLIEGQLFERCKEIFHATFKTRKVGKESFNPIRDASSRSFGAEPVDPATKLFIQQIQRLAEAPDDLQYETIGSTRPAPSSKDNNPKKNLDSESHHSGEEIGRDSAKLIRIFLADFGRRR